MIKSRKVQVAAFATIFLTASSLGFYAAVAQDDGSAVSNNKLSYADLPDRIPVVGDHLKNGFADKKLVLGTEIAAPPRTPAEALQQQSAPKHPTVAPVYNAKGVQIDTFTVGEVSVPGGKSVRVVEEEGQ